MPALKVIITRAANIDDTKSMNIFLMSSGNCMRKNLEIK